MNKKVIHVLLMILIVGAILYVYYSSYTEGLEEKKVEQGPLRCGVDLPSCSGEHVRCINGYCRSDVASALPPFSNLRMTPSTSY